MCTGLFVEIDDGSCYQTRTMEFVAVIPFTPVITDTIMGFTMNETIFVDGINNHGLCVMAFYFRCSSSYNDNNVDGKINLGSHDVCGYLIKNAKSVSDVIELSKKINVTQEACGPPFNSVVPLHWFVSDSTGKTIVIETNKGSPICYDNSKYKVCTNNPTYPEQVANLETLISNNKFTYCNPPDDPNSGLGKGLIGIPGDYSSFGRFARCYLLSKGMVIPGYNINNIETLFNFNNVFDIPYGTVRDCTTNPVGYDFTQYTAVYDLTTLTGYYKTYTGQQIIKIGSLQPAKTQAKKTTKKQPKQPKKQNN
uniref:Choloylglycine hydrolase/NAAA C-terminal domain-containing protein n=1 Tax=viral metagenome TaxID=1070528 RepID=A0A6C0JFJ0_9ZZZZ